MKFEITKLIRRLELVSLYGVSKSVEPITQLLISYVIIKQNSVDLWGEYVELFLWVNAIAIFSYFGNKNYLLKKFSLAPADSEQLWFTSLISRGLFLIAASILILSIPFFSAYKYPLVLWLVLLFFNQSFDVLVLYNKLFRFKISLALSANIVLILGVLTFVKGLSLEHLLYLIIAKNMIMAIGYCLFYPINYRSLQFRISFQELGNSLPFFLPVLLGTIRTKVDAYYGTIFFSKTLLSKYQIFIGILGMIQLGASFAVNPFLKNFYRISENTVKKITKQYVWIGVLTAIVGVPLLYFVFQTIYGFTFSTHIYAYAFLFISTLFIHILLVNEYYKQHRQVAVVKIIFTVAIIQIFLGYFLIRDHSVDGALLVKILGQCAVVLALFLLKKHKPDI
ncbi:MAG: hypothetical protein AB3N14_19980 [Flavobacteriaceae bacterium]